MPHRLFSKKRIVVPTAASSAVGRSCLEEIVISAPGCRLLSARQQQNGNMKENHETMYSFCTCCIISLVCCNLKDLNCTKLSNVLQLSSGDGKNWLSGFPFEILLFVWQGQTNCNCTKLSNNLQLWSDVGKKRVPCPPFEIQLFVCFNETNNSKNAIVFKLVVAL